jgi:glycosyltransferase involved in cell wall biosynthesis
VRILFAGKQHFDPGGIQSSTDQLAIRLVADGHDVAVLAHAAFDGPPRPASAQWSVTCEHREPYAAYAVQRLSPATGLGVVVRQFRPDVLVVNAGGSWWHDWTHPLVLAAPTKLPVALYVRDAEALELLPALAPRLDLVLANAQSHADRAEPFGLETLVIPSVVDLDRYRVEPTGEVVVFINPVPRKGVETAFAIAAARPDVPFEFRESWHLPRAAAEDIAARCTQLGNTKFLRSTTDAAEPYRRARLLLVPYEDGNRPRVIAEAHASGIPVLARDAPAHREAVGPGGILVPSEAPLDAWLAGLDALWADATTHDRYASAARGHSARDEMDTAELTRRLADALDGVVTRGSRARAHVSTLHCERHGITPVASVIVPVRNVAATIEDQLEALSGQTYSDPWEIVIADNGSTDATRARIESWRDRLPPLTIVDASARRGVAHARNIGLRAARGELLLICDGDDIVASGWLERMVAALDDHPVVTGFIELVSLNDAEQYAWTGDATRVDAPVAYAYLPYAPGGNIGMWREVFESVGPFDEDLLRAEDIDFGWRASYAGVGVTMEPAAVLHRRLRSDLLVEFRAAVRGGIAEAGLYRRHRSHGMPRDGTHDVAFQYRWLLRSVPGVVRGERDRHQWTHHAGKRVGRLIGSARERTWFP